MKSTNESNAIEEMERIWRDEPTFYELNLERRVKVLEAKVEELDRVIEGLPEIIAEVLI